MDKEEKIRTNWQEAMYYADHVIQENEKIISIQKEQIRHLEEQVSILEKQNRKLKDAGKALDQRCGELDRICMAQQKALEEYQELFSELFPEK